MKKFIKQNAKHFFVILGFIAISLAFFHPVLQNKIIYQSDIVQYIGMAEKHKDFKADTGEESYWTDAAFVGMPTYQLGANYPYNYIKELDRLIRFLPRPADYLFLYFIGIYILFLTLKVNYKYAIVGALAFGFSTYLIIILGVGHNAKAHAIAYFPVVISGILLCLKNKRLLGFITLFFGLALELNANHFQMTYYLMLLTLVLGIVYLIDALKNNQLPQFLKSVGIMLAAALLAVGVNSTQVLATKEYTDYSTRGDTGLTINPDGSKKAETALSYDYITEYSYGWLESLNLFIPRFMGGSSAEALDTESETFKYLMSLEGISTQQALGFVESAPTYWGEQTYIGAPAYIGASVLFLFVLALFLVNGKLKKWIVSGILLSLLLSLGDNFALLTKFFINYIPLYDKFRAVSSIQAIIEFAVPVLAIVGLAKFFKPSVSYELKLKALKYTSIILGSILVLLYLFSGSFDYSTTNDARLIKQLGPNFIRALRLDREAMLTADVLRTLAICIAVAAILLAVLKQKLQHNMALIGISLVILIDLVSFNKNYVNEEDFVPEIAMQQPFEATSVDKLINKDTTHFRVYDLSSSPLNSSRASYFHNSIGGYHAAKPGRIQDLFDFHIYKGNQQVLNMLNVKYFIFSEQGKVSYQQNETAFGNAWFVEDVQLVNSPNEAIKALDSTNLKSTAVVENAYKSEVPKTSFKLKSKDQIRLSDYQLNQLTYTYNLSDDAIAVFSELYYPKGWKAYVDGEKINHFNANYVLRAAYLPKGNHKLVFKFEPDVITTGNVITLASYGLFFLLLIGGFIYKSKQETT
ncbi:YfhO family protein [Psychroflexus sp. ALD_RP9]|uniref:YfhO family protein n=1 Tax=Psychroflexus sp. ALD_RP9 TaxID=2777186 RepID=UPI001A8CD128|nr:YfhO family protein [Psychroflexus sp. ALD_RP9]QSS96994.1 YfhO family protein [Psychroflexus sp. ALD_RP9]